MNTSGQTLAVSADLPSLTSTLVIAVTDGRTPDVYFLTTTSQESSPKTYPMIS